MPLKTTSFGLSKPRGTTVSKGAAGGSLKTGSMATRGNIPGQFLKNFKKRGGSSGKTSASRGFASSWQS